MREELLGEKKIFEVPTTISETIYRYLRNAIIEGDLRPVQRIHEKEIAERFNISTTPVREAFQKLSAEKYTFFGNQMFFLAADLTKNPSILDKSYKDHIDLMEAVEKRDGKAVEKILLSHWGRGFLDGEDDDLEIKN